jgi:arylsulfatase
MDFHIGRLMKRLRKLGLYENSLIIVTSDHGEAFGERNLVGHGISVYQDMIHVPLVIKYPGERDGEGVDVFVSTVDLMPTILYAAGIDIPETVHGESLQELDREEPRIIVSESYPSNVNYNLHPRFQRIERAVLSRNYKFISSTAGKRELFDLSRDPGEEDNLYGVNTSLSRYFDKSLKTWLEEIKEETHTSNKLGKEAINNLKSLGYIQ